MQSHIRLYYIDFFYMLTLQKVSIERTVYEFLQFPADGLVQFGQRKELFITEHCGDPGRNDTYRVLSIWLILRCTDADRNNGRVVVLSYLMADGVESLFPSS